MNVRIFESGGGRRMDRLTEVALERNVHILSSLVNGVGGIICLMSKSEERHEARLQNIQFIHSHAPSTRLSYYILKPHMKSRLRGW